MATTGRIQVSPGQTISSASWGNLVWDQSFNCFDNAAARDAQWPSPHDGSVCWLEDSLTLWVYRGGWKGVPRGYFAYNTGPGTAQSIGGTLTTILTVTFAAVFGRIYKISGQASGTVLTAAGGPNVRLTDDQGGRSDPINQPSTPINGVAVGSSFNLYMPSSTHTATATLAGIITPSGTFSIGAATCRILVEDIGS